MDIIGMVLGWNWKVRRTRRKWDRLREHALEKKGRLREKALKELDSIEDKMRIIEEERLSRRDRTKMLREVKMVLANISDLLKMGENWLPKEESQSRLQERRRQIQSEY
jgi:hypothetical protein